MSRQKIKTHNAVFQPLIKVVKKSGELENEKLLDENRYIKLTPSGEDCLKIAKVSEPYLVSPRVKAASISFQENYYFIVAGLDNFSDNTFDLPVVGEANPLYAALLEIAIYEFKIPLINSLQSLIIIDEIIHNYMGIDDYDGHDIDTVKQFFIPIELYEIESSYPLKAEQLIKLVGLRLCKQPNSLVLPFSTDTIELFWEVFSEGSSAIPYDNLVQCCYSVSWKHAFLELYLCVERLYPIPVLNELYTKMRFPNSFSLLDLVRNVEEILGWKAPEESSVKKILIDAITQQEAITLLENVKKTSPQTSGTSIHKWFYSIRNNIVHFRLPTQQLDISDISNENWDKIIRATLLIIEAWYKNYEQTLS